MRRGISSATRVILTTHGRRLAELSSGRRQRVTILLEEKRTVHRAFPQNAVIQAAAQAVLSHP